MRIAAVADIHFTRTTGRDLNPLFEHANEHADILLLCGDLTDYGLPEEAHMLSAELKSVVTIPVLGVLGNHDYESGRVEDVHRILCESGVMLLDGDAIELHGVGFAGAKGFAGGFGRGMLSAWGEQAIKDFVQEASAEALKLETALSRLAAPRRVCILHYSPIPETLEGEPREIFPFLGCGRLEEPLKRFPVNVVVHGHAHGGSPEGRTSRGVPVYNVSHQVMRRTHPDGPGYRLIEI